MDQRLDTSGMGKLLVKLLIDCDYIVYKSCAATETEMDFGDDVIVVTSDFTEAMKCTERALKKIKDEFGNFSEMILFFSSPNNFRKKIFPLYKGSRLRKKPCGYKRVIRELENRYKVIKMPQLEADDALGIYSVNNPGNIIVSPDKDMRQIPGQLYDFKETTTITPEQGAKWHALQLTAGDNTDGYTGIPGFGIKKATQLFDNNGYSWKTVVDAYADKGLDETEALLNARLAKILTPEDYDEKKGEPILWTPTTDHIFDGRTRSAVAVN